MDHTHVILKRIVTHLDHTNEKLLLKDIGIDLNLTINTFLNTKVLE